MKRFIWPLTCSFLCLTLGTASGLLTIQGMGTWYPALLKPLGTPPPWVFGPVWSTLYILMGISLGRLLQLKAWRPAKLFALQFALNLAWTPIFFLAHQTTWALIVILTLWTSLLVTLLEASKKDRLAVPLLLPYLLWVSYATYLNTGIVFLNP